MTTEIKRNDIRVLRTVEDQQKELQNGQVRLKIKRFSLTSNNITYAATGDILGYWTFFPTQDKQWGRLPVWGLAEVDESQSSSLKAGQVVFGCLPLGQSVVMHPGKVKDGMFQDMTEHRQSAAQAYNTYVLTDKNTFFSKPGNEDLKILYWGLFATSYLIDDFLSEKSFFQAKTIVLSSASSKTALAAAFLLSRRKGVKVIGLSSESRLGFLRSLVCYDKVYAYHDIKSIKKGAALYIDFSGNDQVNQSVHDHFADHLKYSMIVGSTHWNVKPRLKTRIRMIMSFLLPYQYVKLFFKNPVPEFFFAPTQMTKRINQDGKEAYETSYLQAWTNFEKWAEGWVQFQYVSGEEDIQNAYMKLLKGQTGTHEAYICKLDER